MMKTITVSPSLSSEREPLPAQWLTSAIPRYAIFLFFAVCLCGLLTMLSALVVFAQAPQPGAITQSLKLFASNGQADDAFGAALAANGDRLVVGAPGIIGSLSYHEAGAAYVFARNQGGTDQWGQVAKLIPTNGAALDGFGRAVAISGDVIASGAPNAAIAGQPAQGAVYLFIRNQANPNQWDQVQKLVAADGAANAQFGRALALDGNSLLVGANEQVYLFTRNQATGSWTLTKQLVANDGQVGDRFGADLALSGDEALVSAPGADVAGHTDQGAAYLFGRNQGGADQWGQVKKLTVTNAATSDQNYGTRVAFAGDQAFLEESFWGTLVSFSRNAGGAGNWGQTQLLQQRNFARGLAFNTNRLVTATERGAALFTPDQVTADQWTVSQRFIASDNASGGPLTIADHWVFISFEGASGVVYGFDTTRPAAPAIGFSPTPYTVTENAGAAVITVTLDRPSPYPGVSVRYSTQGSSQALAGVDYTPVSGTLNFLQGATYVTFTVPLINDNLPERPESIALELSSPQGALLSESYCCISFGTLTINDDDSSVPCDFVAQDEASLALAISCANVAGPGTHTISVTKDISLTQPSPMLVNPAAQQIIIEGNGHRVEANGHGRVLKLYLTRVLIRNLTLSGGRVPLDGDNPEDGGGILLQGSHGDGACELTLDQSVVENNEAFSGGAITNVCDMSVMTITHSILRNNHAMIGGGIYMPTGEELFTQLVMNNSTVTNNRAEQRGGGILLHGGDAGSNATISNSTISNNTAVNENGGGLQVETGEAAITNVTIKQSAITGNTAQNGGGVSIRSFGSTNVTLANVTVSSNQAISAAGGLFIQGVIDYDGTNVQLANSTVANNRALTGGGIYQLDGALTLANTIVVANVSGGDCVIAHTPNTPSQYVSNGHNLDSDGACLPASVRKASDIPNGQAKLGPLADNGGPTWTHALLEGSQAIDAGDDAICTVDPVNSADQRGVKRPQGAHCDIGAYEAVAKVSDKLLFVSAKSSWRVGATKFRDEDIVAYDQTQDRWMLIFDGSDVGVTKDVDAFAFLANGNLLLSFNGPTDVPGLGKVDDSDIVEFIPEELGEHTVGSFAWYLHGADVGLTTDGEDIDAIGFIPDGHLVVSTIGDFDTPTASGHDEDLFQLGDDGTWRKDFDGAKAGLANEDINGLWIDPANHDLYLTVKDSFAFAKQQMHGNDIFVCTLSATGACAYQPFWIGQQHGFNAKHLDGIGIGPLPPTFNPAGQAEATNIMASDQATDTDTASDDDVDDGDANDRSSTIFLPLINR